MALHIYTVSIQLVRTLRPLITRIASNDPNLADQLRRALTSVPLNLSEGAYAQGRNARARFYTALASAAEVRACLEVAEALEYIERLDAGVHDLLDRVIATLYRLSRR
jgi:four helix bundle protein